MAEKRSRSIRHSSTGTGNRLLGHHSNNRSCPSLNRMDITQGPAYACFHLALPLPSTLDIHALIKKAS